MNPLKERADSTFLTQLKSLDIELLETHEGSAYATRSSGELLYVNPAWHRFALENEGETVLECWRIGENCFEVIPESLQGYYQDLYRSVLMQPRITRPKQFIYECSSADTIRRFCMSVYALPEMDGVVTVNTLVHSAHRDEQGTTHADESLYRDESGLLHQCAHCRRVQYRPPKGRHWNLVKQWIEQIPEQTSHGLCPICFEYFYRAPSAQ